MMVKINLNVLSKKLGLSKLKISELLKVLESLEVIELKASQQDLQLKMLQARGDDRTINTHVKTIRALQEQKVNQIEAVKGFIRDNTKCYQLKLLDYFGEESIEVCGICSACKENGNGIQVSEAQSGSLNRVILDKLKDGPLSSREILKRINTNENQLLNTLQQMLENNSTRITIENTYTLCNER